MRSSILNLLLSGTIFYATWYSAVGRNTASGEPFSSKTLTCASNFHSFGTVLRLRCVLNDNVVYVRVNDRTTRIAQAKSRLDLTPDAFNRLASLEAGKLEIEVTVISCPTPTNK
jgi:rare lipoprotein A (peptidoglycan hydrolase)